MNLEKAIEINQEFVDTGIQNNIYDFTNAIKLGIEALRAIKSLRANALLGPDEPLIGETEE